MTPLKKTYASNEIHKRWESVYRGNPLQDMFNNRIMHEVIRYLNPPPHALFLDAGCGTGDHSMRIARRGYRCIGIDISESILNSARTNVSKAGLSSKVSLVCQALEDLSLADNSIDFIHCRGVLMHIPEWEHAVGHLCRVLRPGGRIVILEMNDKSFERFLVGAVRRIRSSHSKMIRTAGGIEFWSEEDESPFVVRIANISYLIHQLEIHGVRTVKTLASEFWDINRFPSGVLRNAAIVFNLLWFSLHLPCFPSSGNAIIAEKAIV
jgi:ubiquinone/menaquinone biosynthesis C-methylase UbiE